MLKKAFHHIHKATVVKQPNGDRIKLGGYRRDKKQPHDKTYQASQSASSLPPKIDLRPHMTPVESQGDSNSCTANAMAGAYEYLAKRLRGSAHDVSRLFIYYNARQLDGDSTVDEGTYLRSCIKVLREYGTCSEQTWAFDLNRIYDEPDTQAYEEASGFLIEDAYRIDVDLDAMRSCLAEGYPFAFGLDLFSSFQKAGKKGLVPMPDPDREQHDGGHAMLCVGYSDPDRVFIVRNSWGEAWGDRGYCYIPYDYMTNPKLNDDLWTVRRVSESEVDLSQDIQGNAASLFDLATAAIAHALQDSDLTEDDDTYPVEYEEQWIYVDGEGYVSIDQYENLEDLYYWEEDSEETVEAETEETEDSYNEETEDSYNEETEDSYEEDCEEVEETEDSYEEEFEEFEADETEDSYEEDGEEEEESDEESLDDEEEYDDDEEEYDEEEIEDGDEEEDGGDEEAEDDE